MRLWQVESPKTASVTLFDSAVVEVPLAATDKRWPPHLAEGSCEDRQAHVCSPIVTFALNSATYVDRTGRWYRLQAIPALCSDGAYALNGCSASTALTKFRDVTESVSLAIRDEADQASVLHGHTRRRTSKS
jgi:hypothetical protein